VEERFYLCRKEALVRNLIGGGMKIISKVYDARSFALLYRIRPRVGIGVSRLKNGKKLMRKEQLR